MEDLLFETWDRHQPYSGALLMEQITPLFVSELRRQRVGHMLVFRYWHWHLDKIYAGRTAR